MLISTSPSSAADPTPSPASPATLWPPPVAKEVIRYGGRANLAETDELIGAEAYLLQNTRDLATAQTFLDYVAEFKERLAWHGQTAEGNPTGGNKLRGLYNIALKSIGAAIKRHPDVRLDWVVDYGERMVKTVDDSAQCGTAPDPAPGFYFMNTPGNDLESIAGQVAGGSNLIIFVTGNGSITNFPFVPTIKSDDNDAALRVAAPGDGRERRCLPGRHDDGPVVQREPQSVGGNRVRRAAARANSPVTRRSQSGVTGSSRTKASCRRS